jgi:cell division septation protein DedD
LDPDSAELLYKIIQKKNNVSSEAAVSSASAATDKIPQQEAAVASPRRTLSAAVSTPPQKKDLPIQTAVASKEPASSDEIDSSEESSGPEATRKTGRTSKKDIYSVQLSIFNNKNNAISLAKRLKKKGYSVFIKTEHKDKQTARYRVLVGRFSDKAKALKTSGTILKKEKLKSIIFKH